MNRKFYLFILSFLFLLSRTGAGTINESLIFPHPQINPIVESAVPGLNAINVNKSSNIEIIFSRDMNSASMNSSSIKVYGAYTGYRQFAASYNSSEKKVTINPDNDYYNGEEIIVTLTKHILSAGGDSLIPFTYKFNTGALSGPGLFTEISITNQPEFSNCCTGDFDLDGDIDLLVLNYQTRSLDLYNNNGLASFSYSSSTNLVDTVHGPIVSCDFDGDGDQDAAVIYRSTFDYLKVYLNNGNGFFTPYDTSEFFRTIFTGSARFADIDNDGDMDLFYASVAYGSGGSNNSQICMLINDGSGAFSISHSIIIPSGCPHNYPYQFTTGGADLIDCNNDGYTDIITSVSDFYYPGFNCFEIHGMKNMTNNSFSSDTIIESNGLKIFSSGNFDNDTDMDFVCENSLYENDGSGIFIHSPNLITSNTKSVNDFDGDGDLDILGANTLYRNDGTGSFIPSGVFATLINVENVCAGDFDNDGDIDLISGGKTLYLNKFPDPTVTQVNPSQNAVGICRSTNIEASFSMDMNPATVNSRNVKVYSHNSGYINSAVSYDALQHKALINPDINFYPGEEIYVTLTKDLLLVYGDSLNSFTYCFSTEASGTGNFSDLIILSPGILGLTSGDYDRDGDVDLVVRNSERFAFLTNNGSAAFSEHSSFPYVNFVPENFISNDCDGDGDLDLIFGSNVQQGEYPLRMSVYKNTGGGNFVFDSEYISEPRTTFNNYVRTNDEGNDGDMDLMYGIKVRQSPSVNFSTILLQYNNGTGGFQDRNRNFHLQTSCPFSFFPPENSIQGIEARDYDNDGNLDLAASQYFRNTYLGIDCYSISMDFLLGPTDYRIIDRNDLTNLSAGNFNNDQYLDIVTKGITYENNGAGNFSQTVNSISDNIKITFDADGDGDIDVAGSSRIYLNDGNGNFSASGNFFYPLANENTCASDFDNDGDVDLVSLITITDERSSTALILKLNGYSGTCSINGPENITTGTDSILYYSQRDSGNWSLTNYDNANAVIISSPDNDTVKVNSGSNPGHFVLYYDKPNSFFCNKHVYVDNPLPVELAYFNAAVQKNDVKLNWSTSSETNNAGFEIERSPAGSNWKKIGSVSGKGNTAETNHYEYSDMNLTSGKYKYRLKQIDFSGNYSYHELQNEVMIGIPDKFSLSQNYPNPFNPLTKIEYELPIRSVIDIKVFDITGREVSVLVNEIKDAGYYSLYFNATNLSSGVYYYKLKADNFYDVKKMLLVK